MIPAFLLFALITVAVHEPECPKELRRVRMPLSRSELSEAFLVLRAQSIGVPLMLLPAVLVITNIAAVSAYLVGVLSDRMDRVTVLTRVTIDPAVPNSESVGGGALDREFRARLLFPLRSVGAMGGVGHEDCEAADSPCDGRVESAALILQSPPATAG